MMADEYQRIPSCLVCARCSLFQRNRFFGTIPDSIALLPAATKIDFENNALTGAVPAAFWTNPSLRSLCAKPQNPALLATQERNHAPLHSRSPGGTDTDTQRHTRSAHARNDLSLL
jgi:hypothetical protein